MFINVIVSPDTSGSVEIDGAVAASYPVSRTFATDSTIVLEAKAADGYRFDGWSGDLAGTENPVSVVVSYSMYVTANFSRITHTLTVDASGSGSTSPEIGAHSYDDGSVVSIIATPDKGWEFYIWSGDVADPASTNSTVIVDTDKTVAARFSRIMHTLTVNYDNGGKTTSTLGPYQYAEGTVVNIVATSERGWRFDSWIGDVADPYSASTTVVMDSDKLVTAAFVRTGPDGRVIGIIGGAVGSGLAAFFVTRRKRTRNDVKDTTQNS